MLLRFHIFQATTHLMDVSLGVKKSILNGRRQMSVHLVFQISIYVLHVTRFRISMSSNSWRSYIFLVDFPLAQLKPSGNINKERFLTSGDAFHTHIKPWSKTKNYGVAILKYFDKSKLNRTHVLIEVTSKLNNYFRFVKG